MWTFNYRAEIDGLRAVAVIPVVLFHAGISAFSGGFVGVDVFFVISGYLITGIIISEIDQKKFSIVSFWERRVRRIIPPLILIMTFSIIAGWYILFTEDYSSLSLSVLFQTIFSSNFLFWTESGYFAGPSEHKPLLHTWSLSVEEQFYIAFPLILIAATRFLRSKWPLVIVIGIVCSFCLSVWSISDMPTATFYLLPTRAWELLLGTLLAAAAGKGLTSPKANEVLSWSGLLLIGFAIFAYDSETPFPGLAALLPCVGTALIIFSNGQTKTSVGKLLSVSPLVGIGLISYSLYLWHWPLLVYSKYLSLEPLSYQAISIIIVASVVISWLSWKFIETPIRQRRVLAARSQIFGTMSFGLVAAGLIGMLGYINNGYPSRIPEDAQAFSRDLRSPQETQCLYKYGKEERTYEGDFCQIGDLPDSDPPVFLVWGDSHTTAHLSVFGELANEFGVKGAIAAKEGCIPLLNVDIRSEASYDYCVAFRKSVVRYLDASPIKSVILIARWGVNVSGDCHGTLRHRLVYDGDTDSPSPESPLEVFDRSLEITLAALRSRGIRVWILKELPCQRFDVPHELSRYKWFGDRDYSHLLTTFENHLANNSAVESVFSGTPPDDATILDPTRYFCEPNGFCKVELDGKSLYWDDDHITSFSAARLKPLFRPIFEFLLENERHQTGRQ